MKSYVGENFSGDATDDLLRPVEQWQAREELEDHAKVTIRGMFSRVEGGYWNGGSLPSRSSAHAPAERAGRYRSGIGAASP